jgi:hypothetical protein
MIDFGFRVSVVGFRVEYLVDDRLCGLGLRLLVGREGVNLQRKECPSPVNNNNNNNNNNIAPFM